jgi:proteasome lid subunit RPN8/RPN11
MPLILSTVHLACASEHAERSRPFECCGILLGGAECGDFHVRSVIAAANVTENDRQRHYAVDPKVLLDTHRRARESGHEVIGYYHSHPLDPPVPSAEDAAHAWPGVCYLILGKVTSDAWTTRCWRWNHEAGFLEEAVEIVDEADPKLRRS